MSTTAVTCPKCRQHNVRTIRRMAHDESGRTPVSFQDELSQCSDCGEEFYTYEQSLANSRAYTTALRTAEGLLSHEEIRAARIALDMTQEEFERALGVGQKTVVRWEKGTVPPSRAANGLLWLAARYPLVFLEYARERMPELEGRSAAFTAQIIPAAGGQANPFVMRKTKTAKHGETRIGGRRRAKTRHIPTPKHGVSV